MGQESAQRETPEPGGNQLYVYALGVVYVCAGKEIVLIIYA